jgi:hypothetical protein
MPNYRECAFDAEKHEYRSKETGLVVISCTQVLESVGISQIWPGAATEAKAALGTEVHNACALVDQGYELEEVDPRVRPFLDSYLEFKVKCNWLPVPQMVEFGPYIAMVDGMSVGFKIDRVGLLERKEAIMELKLPGKKPAHKVQLAIYDLCLGEVRRQRFVVQPLETGKLARIFEYNDPSDYSIARAAIAVAIWKANNNLEAKSGVSEEH